MKNEQVKLNYYQVMTLSLKVNELKQRDEKCDKLLVDSFLDYVKNRTLALDVEFSLMSMPNFLERRIKLYTLSSEMFEYLKEVTGINIQDKEVMIEYHKLIDEIELKNDELFKLNEVSKFVKKKIKFGSSN